MNPAPKRVRESELGRFFIGAIFYVLTMATGFLCLALVFKAILDPMLWVAAGCGLVVFLMWKFIPERWLTIKR